MKSVFSFIVEPLNGRYENEVNVGDKKLIINSRLEDHRFVSRIGRVVAEPINNKTNISKGDLVIVHHNVFRRFYNVRGFEKNSSAYFKENMYFCYEDQIFLYKKESGDWKAADGYCFVKPIRHISKSGLIDNEKEQPLIGILKYGNSSLEQLGFNEGDLIGFTPNSEYEFLIENQRLYRMTTNSIIIKYEYEGNEIEYNPSWAKGS
jgi:hypothetical protein